MNVTVDRAEKSQEVVRLMATGLSLRKSCIQAEIPAPMFLRAVDASPELAEQYTRARQALLDKMADEILELADAPVPVLDNGATDNALVRQRQLQVDTRKWFLSKLAPKVYGDRLDVSVSDTRISINGALQAAQSRLVDVIDVTPRLTSSHDDSHDDSESKSDD
jgi:DNA-binding helix-hairpin-helix protein with protein kinase domain